MEVLSRGQYSGNIIVKSAKEGFIASVTQYGQEKCADPVHSHSNVHFGFTIEGGCLEKKKTPYEILPGDITYYYAGEEHQLLRILKPSRRVNLELEQKFVEEFHVSEDRIHHAVTKMPDAKFLMVQIYKELMIRDDFSLPSIQMTLLNLLGGPDGQPFSKAQPGWVNQVNEYLHAHFSEPVSLKDLAAAGNVHPVTVSRSFPKYFGCTLGEYMRKLKIERSLAMIRSPEASLTAVAYSCGFFDQSHFTRVFSELNGVLPSVYRKL